MLTNNDILKLVNAGFSRAEIIKMGTSNNQPQPQNGNNTGFILPQQPQQPQQPLNNPYSYIPASQQTMESQMQVANLQQAINDLKTVIQQQNIATLQTAPQPQETTDDILAKIINPDIPTAGQEPNGGGLWDLSNRG